MVKIKMIGTDPEMILQKKTGEYICAIPYLGGASKKNPFPMTNEDGSVKEGFMFMHDRATVEFNIPPTLNFQEFKSNLQFAKDYILNLVNSNYGKNDIIISEEASAYFPWEELTDKASTEIGCMPSWSAWTNSQNEIPDVRDSSQQCSAFHFHCELDFGYSDKYYIMLSMLRAMDLFMGVPSVILDTDTERRKLYGLPGEFRNHLDVNRFEYRTLSNFLLFNDTYLEFMWNQIFKACDYVNEFEIIEGELGEAIQKCISTSDVSLAYDILKDQKIIIPQRKEILV